MNVRNRDRRLFLFNLFVMLILLLGVFVTPAIAQEDGAAAQTDSPSVPAALENLVWMYSAKFVCTEALKPGQYFYGVAAPIVQQSTDVLIHNPNAFPVRLYKKAVIAPLENFGLVEQGVEPGKWKAVSLKPDFAFRIDCDDIAKLLTGDPAATFLGKYGLGVTVEGFVVIGVGQQPVPGSNLQRFAPLDVTADYVRSSEVMKKDIHYQPWWRWWWWNLPWRLGYPYHRIVRLQPSTGPATLDLRKLLVDSLTLEVQQSTTLNEAQKSATLKALDDGLKMELEPNSEGETAEQPAALVALLGSPTYLSNDGSVIDIPFVLVSNKTPSEANPIGGNVVSPVAVKYPWIPGHWYDLPVIMPQNVHTDLHQYFTVWHTQRWATAATNVDVAAVRANMLYWYPYWCGWGYWWWSWRGTDCIDIGVGEGESLDVESVTPVRVFMPQWPPANQ